MVVVIGAGIAGAASAYYLAQAGCSTVTVVDAVGPAACSSGKAGAFLSESWGDGTRTEALHRKSFRLHEQLAQDLALTSFQKVPAFRAETESGTTKTISGNHAMVDPAELTNKLLESAMKKGVALKTANIEEVEVNDCGFVTNVVCDDGRRIEVAPENLTHEDDIDESNSVVFSMGPWTSRLEDWLSIPVPIDGVLSSSLVYHNMSHVVDGAAFLNEDFQGCHLEVLPRKDDSLYVSGCGESPVISTTELRGPKRPIPGEQIPVVSRISAARDSLDAMKYVSRDREPDCVQACIRPTSPDGMPIVGRLGKSNCYVASGGGAWGITFGPLMGKAMASIIKSDDNSPLRPSSVGAKRFDTLLYRSLLQARTSS